MKDNCSNKDETRNVAVLHYKNISVHSCYKQMIDMHLSHNSCNSPYKAISMEASSQISTNDIIPLHLIESSSYLLSKIEELGGDRKISIFCT